MLPVKLYPTFVARQDFNKLDLTLKANCRLPANLRIKEISSVEFNQTGQSQVTNAKNFNDIEESKEEPADLSMTETSTLKSSSVKNKQ